MAKIYEALGRADSAAELRAEAGALFRKFNETFWNEAEGFYAYTLDGMGTQRRTVCSSAFRPDRGIGEGRFP
jgi:glycogen debranching enzyme